MEPMLITSRRNPRVRAAAALLDAMDRFAERNKDVLERGNQGAQ